MSLLSLFFKLIISLLKLTSKLIFSLILILFEVPIYFFITKYLFIDENIIKNSIEIEKNTSNKVKFLTHLKNSFYFYFKAICYHNNFNNYISRGQFTPGINCLLNIINKNFFFRISLRNFYLSKPLRFNILFNKQNKKLDFKKLLLEFKKKYQNEVYTDNIIHLNLKNYKIRYQKKVLFVNNPTINNVKNSKKKKFEYRMPKQHLFSRVAFNLNKDFVLIYNSKNKKYEYLSHPKSKKSIILIIKDFLYKLVAKNKNSSMIRYKDFSKKNQSITSSLNIEYTNVIFATSGYLENYFHYIFEILIPCYSKFIQFKESKKVLIPDVFPNLKSVIKYLFKDKVIFIKQYDKICFTIKNAVCANFLNCFDNIYTEHLTSEIIKDQFYVDKKSLKIFVSALAKYKQKKINKNCLVLLRKNVTKRPENFYYLYEYLQSDTQNKKNFILKETADLKLEEQIKIFSTYSKIISPIGASLTNIIFCKPKSVIYVLCPRTKKNFYLFWKAIAELSNIELRYYAFPISKFYWGAIQHSNYNVNHKILYQLDNDVKNHE